MSLGFDSSRQQKTYCFIDIAFAMHTIFISCYVCIISFEVKLSPTSKRMKLVTLGKQKKGWRYTTSNIISFSN